MKTEFHRWAGIALRLLTLLLLALPALFQAGPAAYLPGSVFLFLWILCAVCLRENRRHISVQDRVSEIEARRGSSASAGILLENSGPFPCVLAEAELTLSDPDGIPIQSITNRLSVEGRSAEELRFALPMHHVGIYRLGLSGLRLWSPFTLLSVRLSFDRTRSAIVLPHLWSIEDILLPETAAGEDTAARIPTGPDGMDYSGVREYRPGDPMQRIHWKLSAHSGTLLTRQLELYGSPGMSVCVDFYSEEADRERRPSLRDGLFESASLFCRASLAAGLETELRLSPDGEAVQILPVQTDEDADTPVYTPELTCPELSCSAALLSRCLSDGKGTVLLIAETLSDEASDLLLRLQNGGRNVLFLLVLPNGLSDKELSERRETARQTAGPDLTVLFWQDPSLPGGGVGTC